MFSRISKLFIYSVILLWANMAVTALGVNVVYPDWFKQSFYDLRADLDDARNDGKKGIMLFFSMKTCSYCQAIIETAFKQPDIVQGLRKNYDVIGVDVFSDTEVTDLDGKSYWSKEFAVVAKAKFTPTMIFYGTDGKVQLRLIGYQSPEKMRAVLSFLEGEHYTSMSLRDYMQNKQAQTNTQIDVKNSTNLDRRQGSDKQLLVVFESADCAKCQLLRTMLKNEIMQPYLLQLDLVFVRSDSNMGNIIIPSGQRLSGQAWANQLGLIHQPSLVFFNEKGEEVLRVDTDILIDAYGKDIAADDEHVLDNIRARLQFVVDKGYVELPQFQRWRRAQQSR